MRLVRMFALAAILVSLFAASVLADNSERIYGRITTVDGDEFEGYIRWDKNEGAWVDYLNGNKDLHRSNKSHRRRYSDRKKKITIFGIPIGYSSTLDYYTGSAQCGVRFGHMLSIEVIDDDAVLITLKSGRELELESGSTDIGTNIRELVIEDPVEGEIEFEWDDIESIEFKQGGSSDVSSFGKRLFGTVVTRRGDEFSGWICWDIDETFSKDVIDGKEKGRNREIKFENIREIHRRNSSSADLILVNGKEITLRGTNDVDSSNRGIVVTDLDLGEVVIRWKDFESLQLHSSAPVVRYDDFDGGDRLRGTVYTEDGDQYSGQIRWDDDEEYTWELLDGNYRDIEFNIEFGNIAEIHKKGSRSAIVILKDGRTFRLRGSNDVDGDNKGIFIETVAGDEEEIYWEDFEKVIFGR
ncbi:MAG: hypothetical protein KAV42_10345 [Candidatus Krumholzibacteria bacterium]|nr:hypothetical protein [Candidatus Krumholzibacteria bacterium]